MKKEKCMYNFCKNKRIEGLSRCINHISKHDLFVHLNYDNLQLKKENKELKDRIEKLEKQNGKF